MTWKTLRAWRTWRALTAALTLVAGLSAAAASPAFAGLDGPVAANMDQHCAVETIGSGPTTIAIPVDRVTLNLEAAGHDPNDSSITATYSIVGTTKTGTTTGKFDPVKSNVTLTFTVASPPLGAELDVHYQVSWTDGTSYDNTARTALAPCTLANTTAVNTSTWNNYVEVADVSQQCTTVRFNINGLPVYIREDIVTVDVAHGSPYPAGWYAGQAAWADYWIPGHKGYTSGASGTFDSTGHARLTFRLLAPNTGSELDVLASGRESGVRTFPAHTWTTIAC
ncbi:hypothetical protein [Streptomyces sp. NPDC058964]|uniref:hypothetical protein n=1 Tax=Streptomyces sp. NPDC058964 TaxID=3346681 RepID=UPI0036BCBC0F